MWSGDEVRETQEIHAAAELQDFAKHISNGEL